MGAANGIGAIAGIADPLGIGARMVFGNGAANDVGNCAGMGAGAGAMLETDSFSILSVLHGGGKSVILSVVSFELFKFKL